MTPACDVEVEIVNARVGPSRRLLEIEVKTASGDFWQDGYSLSDPRRILALAEATGLGRVSGFAPSDFVGRRMLVDVDEQGNWCCERPVRSPPRASMKVTVAAPTPTNVSVAAPKPTITLQDVRDAYKTYLLIDDDAVIDAPLAAHVAHGFAESEAVALVVVGPSSSVKTEVVCPLGSPKIKGHSISDLTSKTLVSGWRSSKGNASLLNTLHDNVLVIKDLTTILSGRADERAKVLGQLREILDGSYQQEWGNGESIDWTGKLSVVAACTPVLDQHHAAIAQLGTRFLYIRTAIDDPNAIALKAMKDGAASKQARANAKQVVVDFLGQFLPVPLNTIGLPDEHCDKLAHWATFLATARTPVIRDSYGREIVEAPVVEGPARAVKQLHQLAAARARLDGRRTIEGADLAFATRIAWDSIPLLRARVLASVLKKREVTIKDVAEDVQRLGATLVRRSLEDLYALGLLDRTKEQADGGYRCVPSAALDGIEPVESVRRVPEKTSEGDK